MNKAALLQQAARRLLSRTAFYENFDKQTIYRIAQVALGADHEVKTPSKTNH